MTDRPALLLQDILEAPAALQRLLDEYDRASGPLAALDGARSADRRILFTGLGSSRYAAFTAPPALRSAGIGAWVEFASSDATPPSDDLVVVAISASGGTTEVVETARRHRGTSLVIGVTNEPTSTLAREVDIVLPLFAGEERSGVANRTFRATLVVLALLASRLTGTGPSTERFRPAVDGLGAAIDGRDEWLAATSDHLDGAPLIDVVGAAGDLGLVSQAALMLREGPRLPAQAHEAGDWLHTSIYLALPGHRVLLFRGAVYDERLVRIVAGRGGETVVIGDPLAAASLAIPMPFEPPADPVSRALVSSVVAEILATELWDRAAATER